MNPVEAGNPYQAPEASIAALEAEIRRPPVYTAISLFCWALGVFHFVYATGVLYFLKKFIDRLGWRKALHYTAWPDPRPLLFFTSLVVGTALYLTAARLLWTRRGHPGLILCGTGIGITYLAVWFLRPK